MANEKVVIRGVSMYRSQWDLVRAYARSHGNLSTSAAVRAMLAEWRSFTRARVLADRGETEAPDAGSNSTGA